ncbi:MAG: polysaccharide deacetylase family protein [Treponema sp.]|nr:polysaccharide deacetylase family protein [Treponema sp.]
MKLLAGLIVPAVFLAAGCGDEQVPDKKIDVVLKELTANGSETETTTILTFEFDKDIAGLETADIAFNSGSTGAFPNNLTKVDGQTGIYKLTVRNIKASGEITVLSIEKSGYAITGTPKTAAVHCYTYTPEPNSKEAIEAFVNAHWEEYGYSEKPTKYIALSFDDGPCAASNSGGTVAMLAKLEELNVKATFFVIGQNIRGNQSAAKAIFDAGHELANHSDGYGALGSATEASITTSLTAASTAIKNITGADPALFRAPNVDYGTGTNLAHVCTELGLAIIGVSVWSNDYDGGVNSAQIVTNVVNNTFLNSGDGGIINCHESNTSGGRTLAALPDMIAGLRSKGFWIMTVGELAIVKGINLQVGTRYDSIPIR